MRSRVLNVQSLYASELPSLSPLRPGVAVFCVDTQSDSRYQWDYSTNQLRIRFFAEYLRLALGILPNSLWIMNTHSREIVNQHSNTQLVQWDWVTGLKSNSYPIALLVKKQQLLENHLMVSFIGKFLIWFYPLKYPLQIVIPKFSWLHLIKIFFGSIPIQPPFLCQLHRHEFQSNKSEQIPIKSNRNPITTKKNRVISYETH